MQNEADRYEKRLHSIWSRYVMKQMLLVGVIGTILIVIARWNWWMPLAGWTWFHIYIQWIEYKAMKERGY